MHTKNALYPKTHSLPPPIITQNHLQLTMRIKFIMKQENIWLMMW